jgi:hypothetical protein
LDRVGSESLLDSGRPDLHLPKREGPYKSPPPSGGLRKQEFAAYTRPCSKALNTRPTDYTVATS